MACGAGWHPAPLAQTDPRPFCRWLTAVPIYGSIKHVQVLGEMVLARFATKHAGSRKPLQRFLEIARSAEWPHYSAVKDTFGATDMGRQTGRLIFDIGGNK